MNIFEQAARLKIRYTTSKGLLSVEDLWDLPLTSPSGRSVNLDDMAKDLFKSMRDSETPSFVTQSSAVNTEAVLKLDLLKHVISAKIVERDVAAAATAKREKKQQIMALIAEKENAALGALGVDDLRKMLEQL